MPDLLEYTALVCFILLYVITCDELATVKLGYILFPLPVYLAGEKDWQANNHAISLPTFASRGVNPRGS